MHETSLIFLYRVYLKTSSSSFLRKKLYYLKIIAVGISFVKNKIAISIVKKIKVAIYFREMLATHILTHTFQHTLFDWLKSTWVLPN